MKTYGINTALSRGYEMKSLQDKEVSDALEKCSDIFRETFHGDIGKEVVWEIDVKMDKEHRKYWKDVTFLMNYNHKMEIGELRYISSGKDVGKETHESNI